MSIRRDVKASQHLWCFSYKVYICSLSLWVCGILNFSLLSSSPASETQGVHVLHKCGNTSSCHANRQHRETREVNTNSKADGCLFVWHLETYEEVGNKGRTESFIERLPSAAISSNLHPKTSMKMVKWLYRMCLTQFSTMDSDRPVLQIQIPSISVSYSLCI